MIQGKKKSKLKVKQMADNPDYVPSFLIQYFAFEHLPEKLQIISKPFGELAMNLDQILPNNPEKTTALRKLLESKDCAVRAVIAK